MDKSIGQKFEFKTVLLVLVILLALVILIGGLFGREPANELEVKDEVKQVELADTVSLQVDSASLTTVAEVMMAAEAAGTLTMEYTDYGGELGIFVEAINGVANDTANDMYWILYVNGANSQVGASVAAVQAGDAVTWKYEPLEHE